MLQFNDSDATQGVGAIFFWLFDVFFRAHMRDRDDKQLIYFWHSTEVKDDANKYLQYNNVCLLPI